MQNQKKNQIKQTTNRNEKSPKEKYSTSLQIFLVQNMAENLHLVEHNCVEV